MSATGCPEWSLRWTCKAAAAAVATLILGACSSPPPAHEYGGDRETLRKSFAAVVRKHYSGRSDGELSEATLAGYLSWMESYGEYDPNSMRFVFKYVEPVNKAESEMIDIYFVKKTRTKSVVTNAPNPSAQDLFRVVVHRSRPGSDEVLAEKGEQFAAEIKAMMADRGK